MTTCAAVTAAIAATRGSSAFRIATPPSLAVYLGRALVASDDLPAGAPVIAFVIDSDAAAAIAGEWGDLRQIGAREGEEVGDARVIEHPGELRPQVVGVLEQLAAGLVGEVEERLLAAGAGEAGELGRVETAAR